MGTTAVPNFLRNAYWLICLALFACPALAQTLPRAPGTALRALVWNVSREQFFDQQLGFVAALRAMDADLIILDEMSAQRTAPDVVAMLKQVDDAPWQVAYGSSGHNQRAVFALRGDLSPLASFKYLPYPPRFVREMQAIRLNPRQQGQMGASLDAGIAAFGAEARHAGRRLLVVGVDLQCCGDTDDAWEERRRHVEARIIRRTLEQAWSTRRPDAVIVAGDFNAVRGLTPVELMQGSRNRPQQRLSIASARHANGKDSWTWDGRGTPFPSRPIDFMLHSAQLKVLNALVFDPETMSEAQRQTLGLSVDQFIPLSAHRPIVVDFAWR